MEITFLKEEQIWGDGALQVMQDYGVKTGLTDMAVLLGGLMGGAGYKTVEDDLCGYAWSASPDEIGGVRVVGEAGDRYSSNPD